MFTFQDLYLINELKFEGYPHSWPEEDEIKPKVKEPFCYTVEMSKDLLQWVTVVDHSKCKCYATQQLYFPKQAARWVGLIIPINDMLIVVLLL